MPAFEKLSDAEVQKLGKRRQTALDLSEYHAFLDRLNPGDWGRMRLADDENQRAIKRRLTTASKQRGKEIKYKRSTEGEVIFQIK